MFYRGEKGKQIEKDPSSISSLRRFLRKAISIESSVDILEIYHLENLSFASNKQNAHSKFLRIERSRNPIKFSKIHHQVFPDSSRLRVDNRECGKRYSFAA